MAKRVILRKNKIVKVYNKIYTFYYHSSLCRVTDREQATVLNEAEAEKIKNEIVLTKLSVNVLIEDK